jgi:hypothetical protein
MPKLFQEDNPLSVSTLYQKYVTALHRRTRPLILLVCFERTNFKGYLPLCAQNSQHNHAQVKVQGQNLKKRCQNDYFSKRLWPTFLDFTNGRLHTFWFGKKKVPPDRNSNLEFLLMNLGSRNERHWEETL